MVASHNYLGVCLLCGQALQNGTCTRCALAFALEGGTSTAATGRDPLAPHVTDLFSAPELEFDCYRLEQREDGTLHELGRGGMGVTYLAYDKNLQLHVAIKFIRPDLVRDSAMEERFLREARVAAQLSHPHIAAVRQLGRNSGRWYYAMELAEGEDLERWVKGKGPLSEKEAQRLAMQLASALGEAGRRRIVHRDIKPSNIMLEWKEGQIHAKVIDFGLVKRLDTGMEDLSLTTAGMVGTPHFASPEQLRERAVDQRSDFYSLGATLYFALTGETLFHGSRLEVVTQHLAGKVNFSRLPRLPKGLADLLESCLQTEIQRRPPNSAALEEMLQRRGRRRPGEGLVSRGFLWLISIILASAALAHSADWERLRSWWDRDPPPPLAPEDKGLKPEVAYQLAKQHYRRSTKTDNEYARALLLDAIPRAENSGPLRARLAMVHCQRMLRFGYSADSLGVAEKWSAEAAEQDPKGAEIEAARAMLLYAKGNFPASERALRLAVAKMPREAEYRRSLSVVLREQGRMDEAYAEAKAATDVDGSDWGTWSIRGNIEKKLQLFGLAEASYRKALEISPPSPEPRLGLIHTLYLQGKWEEAERCLEPIMRTTDRGDTHALAAQLALQKGDLEQAEGQLRIAVEAKPDGNPRYFGQIRYESLLAWVLRQRGRAGADDSDTRALTMDRSDCVLQPRNSDFQASLAGTLAGAGRTEAALRVLGRAIELGWDDFPSARRDPRWQNGLEALQRLESAKRLKSGR